MEMEAALEEIGRLLSLIQENLGMNLEIQEMGELLQSKLYIQLFERMFPFLDVNIRNLIGKTEKEGEKIQILINLLSSDILTMDLSHIKGVEIENGDLKHLLNFLQILLELSNLIQEKNDHNQDENNNSSVENKNSSAENQDTPNQNDHQIQDEFNNQDNYIDQQSHNTNDFEEHEDKVDDIYDTNSHKHTNIHQDQDQEELNPNNQEIISEVSKSKESSIQKQNQKNQIKNKKSLKVKNDKVDKNQAKKNISKQIFNKQLQQGKNMTTNPKNMATNPKKVVRPQTSKPTKPKKSNVNNCSNEEQDEQNMNLNEIVQQNYDKMKNNFPNKKNEMNVDEPETVKQIVRQRDQYKSGLNDYLKGQNIKTKSNQQKQQRQQQNFTKKLKILQAENMNFMKAVEHEKMANNMKIQDEKRNYLRKIHRIIFELEKRKVIEERKQFMEERKVKNEQTRIMLSAIENSYNDRISILKDKLSQQKKERKLAELDQKQIISKLEQELKREKNKQLENIRNHYNQEKNKFDMLIKDDGTLEQKIMELYQKN